METVIGANETVSSAVIRAVSAVNGQKPESLRPLTDVIDPDALDALFNPRSNDGQQTDGRLSFSYSSCRITIDNGEILTIEPLETTGGQSGQSGSTDRAVRSRSNPDTRQAPTRETPESCVCFVCQRPIEREELQRERGEFVHLECRAELRCGISLETWAER